MDQDKKSFGQWLKDNSAEILVYTGAALIIGGSVVLAVVAMKEEVAQQEQLQEAARKRIAAIMDAHSRGALVLAGPNDSTWIVEADKVDLLY